VDAALISAIIGAAFGALAGGAAQFLLDRRRERVRVRALVLLTRLELEDVAGSLEQAKAEDRWWSGPLESLTWQEHRAEIAIALSEDDLLVLHSAFKWFNAANAAAEQGRASGPAAKGPADALLLDVLPHLVGIATATLDAVSQGGRWLRRHTTPYCLAPDLREPCDCGHPFGEHRWIATKRWLRTSHFRVRWADVAHECPHCDCQQFRYAGDRSQVKRRLRRLRVLPPAPYLLPVDDTKTDVDDGR